MSRDSDEDELTVVIEDDVFDDNMPLSTSLVQRCQKRDGERYKHLLTQPRRGTQSSSHPSADDSVESLEDDFSENMTLSDSIVERAQRRVGEKYAHLKKPRPERHSSKEKTSGDEGDDSSELEDDYNENMPLSESIVQKLHRHVGKKYQHLRLPPRKPSELPAEDEKETQNDETCSTVDESNNSEFIGPSPPPEDVQTDKDEPIVESEFIAPFPPPLEDKESRLSKSSSSNGATESDQSIFQSTPQRPGHRLKRGSTIGITPIVKERPIPKRLTLIPQKISDSSQSLSPDRINFDNSDVQVVPGTQSSSSEEADVSLGREKSTNHLNKLSQLPSSNSISSPLHSMTLETDEETTASSEIQLEGSSQMGAQREDDDEQSQGTRSIRHSMNDQSSVLSSVKKPRTSETFSMGVDGDQDLSQSRKSLKTFTRESNTRSSKSSLSSTSRSQWSNIPGTQSSSSEEADVSLGREKSTNHLNKLSQLPSSNSISSPLHSMTLETDEETTASSEIQLEGSSQMGGQREDDNEQSQGTRRCIRHSINDQSSVLSSVKRPQMSETFSMGVDSDQDLNQRKSLKTSRESNTRSSKSSLSSTSRSQSSKIQHQFEEEKGEENNATQHSSRSSASGEENNNSDSKESRKSQNTSKSDEFVHDSSISQRSETRPRASETFSMSVNDGHDLSQRKSLKTFTRESSTRSSKSSLSSTSRSQSSKIQHQFEEEKGEENNATQHSSRSSSSGEENDNSDTKESRKSQNTSKSDEFVHNSSISQRSETRPRASETFSMSVNDGHDLSQRKSLKSFTRESARNSRSQSSKIQNQLEEEVDKITQNSSRERNEDEESEDDDNASNNSVFYSESDSMKSRGSVTTLNIENNFVEPVTNPPLSYDDMLATALARSKRMNAVDVGDADLLLNTQCPMSGSGRQLKTNCLYPMLNLRRIKVPKRKEQEKLSPVKLSESSAKVPITSRSSVKGPMSSNSSIKVLKPSNSSIKVPMTSRLSRKGSISSNSSKSTTTSSRHKRLKGTSQSNQSVTPARIYGPVLSYLSRTLSQSSFQSSQISTASRITNDKIGITMDQVDDADKNIEIENLLSSQTVKTQSSPHASITKEFEAVESENDEQDEEVTSHPSRANSQTDEFANNREIETTDNSEEENDESVEAFRKSQSLMKKSLKRHEITNREMEVTESEDEVVVVNTSLKKRQGQITRIITSESEEDVVELVDKEKTIQPPQKQRPKLKVVPNKAPLVATVSGSKRKLANTRKKKTLADLMDNSNLISKDYLTQAIREKNLKFSKSELDSFHKFLNEELERLCDSLCEQAGRSYGMFTYRQLEDALKKKKLIDPALGRNSLLIMIASILPHSTYEKAKGLLIPKDGDYDTVDVL